MGAGYYGVGNDGANVFTRAPNTAGVRRKERRREKKIYIRKNHTSTPDNGTDFWTNMTRGWEIAGGNMS